MKNLILMLALLLPSKLLALELIAYSDFAQRLALNIGVSGYVSEVLIREGQSVKQGQDLIKLDRSRFQSALKRAQANLVVHLPKYSQMLIDLEKAQELYDRDTLSRVELQQAENNLQRAEGMLGVAKAELRNTELDLQQASLQSPIDGLVLQLNTHQHRFINARVSDNTLVTVVDNRNMHAIAELTAEQWDSDLIGKSATVVYQSQRYPGEVVNLDFESVQNASGQSRYELRVLFVASGEIPANMPLTIEIQE